jgi:hypothetical protein
LLEVFLALDMALSPHFLKKTKERKALDGRDDGGKPQDDSQEPLR